MDFHEGDPGEEQDLRGVNGTYRYQAGTYIKSEYAYSNSIGSPTLTSITGGLSFNPVATNGSPASAKRVETAVDLAEVTDTWKRPRDGLLLLRTWPTQGLFSALYGGDKLAR